MVTQICRSDNLLTGLLIICALLNSELDEKGSGRRSPLEEWEVILSSSSHAMTATQKISEGGFLFRQETEVQLFDLQGKHSLH